MKVAGVIAEFDPFHNGHAFFLRRVRELTSADFIIAVMSGDFTQRGNIAVAGKRLRAEAALKNGADIVIELPVHFATATAEIFATGGVSLLDTLGCVDVLCFGTESDDIELLKDLACVLGSETETFKESLATHLKEGMSYPASRMAAVIDAAEIQKEPVSGLTEDIVKELMSRPNNILAIEYMKALHRTGSDMDTLNVRREAVDHDSVNTYGAYSSAGNIRQILKATHSLDAVGAYLPENTLPIMREHFDIDWPVFDDDMSSLMKYRLLMEDETSLMQYADMSTDLARRVIKRRPDFISVTQFTELIKSRNLTYTRISRALLHTFLSVTKEDMRLFEHSHAANGEGRGYLPDVGYIRILGFRKEASSLIDMIRESSGVPVIFRSAEYKKLLKKPNLRIFEDGLRVSEIYNSIVKDIYGTDITSDISTVAIAKDGLVLA